MVKQIKIIFWGTGNTAKEKLSQIKEVSHKIATVIFTDSNQSNTEINMLWEGYNLISPQRISEFNADFLCILSIWEWDIRKQIYHEKLFDLSRIISFNEAYMMALWEMDLDGCHEKMLQSVFPKQVSIMEEWVAYAYLKRNYSYILCDSKYWNVSMRKKVFLEENIRPIWILWLQGLEQAPKLVKTCIKSIMETLGGQEQIFLLDERSLFEYIDLPEYIVKKWRAGTISSTHFSDLVRVRLLNLYGGIWIDATVYFTGNQLSDYIKENELFLFHRWPDWNTCTEPRIAANWLISAAPGNKILIILETMLNEYWKKEDGLINYFIFHIFLYLIAECFPDEWQKIEKIPRDSALLLSREIEHEFNSNRLEHIKKLTDIHKLSYKAAYAQEEANLFGKENGRGMSEWIT